MPKRILYVEDNANTAMALKAMLELKGYSVVTAGSIKEASVAIKNDAFEVIISDIGLPDGQGWDILKSVRTPSKTIALSGYTDDRDRQTALDKGFSAFLTKPFSTQDLIDEIERT
jgi:DNA-binding response OmpR family regulator